MTTDAIWKAVRPALMTALFTFLGVFATGALGWLSEVSGWLSAWGSPEAGEFPDPSVLGTAVISGIVAAAGGLVNFIVRWLQIVQGWGKPPTYE